MQRRSKKVYRYWTYERVKKEAKKYKRKSDWFSKSRGSYNAAYGNGWFDKVSAHMPSSRKPRGYWTKDKVRREAKKYQLLKDFREKSLGAYSAALEAVQKGLIKKIFSQKEIQNPQGYWTFSRVRSAAKK